MNAITLCVAYDDLLAITLPAALQHFGRVVVVTVESDWQTIALASGKRRQLCFSKRLYAYGASFNKGAALEEGFDAMGRNDWICQFDADCLLPPWTDFSGIEPGNLYVARRRTCDDPRQYRQDREWSEYPLVEEKSPFDCGCVQVFHADDPVLATQPWYPTHWKHAGECDREFNAKWPEGKRHYLPFEVLHLGEPYKNWHGRQTRRLDGMLPDGAAEARLRTEAMYRARGKHGYRMERLD